MTNGFTRLDDKARNVLVLGWELGGIDPSKSSGSIYVFKRSTRP